jgi:hypothetical protein
MLLGRLPVTPDMALRPGAVKQMAARRTVEHSSLETSEKLLASTEIRPVAAVADTIRDCPAPFANRSHIELTVQRQSDP